MKHRTLWWQGILPRPPSDLLMRLPARCQAAATLALVLLWCSQARATGIYYCTIQVSQPERHLVHVTYVVSEVSGTVSLVRRAEGYDPDGAVPSIQRFRALLDGRPLSMVQAGQSYRVLVPVLTTPQRPLVIEYDCVLHQIHPDCKAQDQYEAYLDGTFGILRANYLFVQPEPDASLIAARFLLPSGWQAITPWEIREGWHLLRASGQPNIDFGDCMLGFGPFTLKQRQIGPTLVTVGMVGDLAVLRTGKRFRDMGGESPVPPPRLPDMVFRLFEYYLGVIGDCAVPRYIVFFHPLTADGRWVNCSAWATGTAHEYGAAPEWIAHEIFHWWNRVVATDKDRWASEHWTWLFAWDGVVRTGSVPRSHWKRHLRWCFEGYLAKVGRPEDHLPAATPDDQLSPEQLNSLFGPRQILAYGLNEEIRAATNGTAGLADVIAFLYRQFMTDPPHWRERICRMWDIERAVAAVGGQRPVEFIRKYISGTEVLVIPDLASAWFNPWMLRHGQPACVRFSIRPPEYLLRDRKRAAIVVRFTGNVLSRAQLKQFVSPSLRADIAIGSEEINKKYGTAGRTYDYDAEAVYTVAVRKAGDAWVADLTVLPVRNARYFIWDSTGHDYSGRLHEIACCVGSPP